MNEKFVIFRSPHLRFREESFGGIAKLKLKTLIVNMEQYKLIEKIEKAMSYEDLSVVEKKNATTLIKNNIFLKVDLEKAKKLGF
jgi:hypothetical protein